MGLLENRAAKLQMTGKEIIGINHFSFVYKDPKYPMILRVVVCDKDEKLVQLPKTYISCIITSHFLVVTYKESSFNHSRINWLTEIFVEGRKYNTLTGFRSFELRGIMLSPECSFLNNTEVVLLRTVRNINFILNRYGDKVRLPEISKDKHLWQDYILNYNPVTKLYELYLAYPRPMPDDLVLQSEMDLKLYHNSRDRLISTFSTDLIKLKEDISTLTLT